MTKTELLYSTHEKFLKIGLGILPMTDLDELIAPSYMGLGTAEDEKFFSVADLRSLIERQNEQSVGMDMQYDFERICSQISPHEMSAFVVDNFTCTFKIGEEQTQMKLRFSCVYDYHDNKWLAVHSHGSKPELVETATDTWGLDEWKQKTEILEKIVAERTAEIVKQKKELEKTLSQLKATQTQLIQSEKLASLGELTAGIAHEIQNPLNFVNNFSELSIEIAQELDEEVRKPEFDKGLIIDLANDLNQNQEKINEHGKRASSIVKGMLEHSRKSSGDKEPIDINALCDEYLRLSYHGLRAKDKSFNASFELRADENLPKVHVIPQDFGRVLLNLINNAFWAVNDKKIKLGDTDFTPIVVVSTQLSTDNSVLITIKDNGNGIPQEIKDKVFQPFFTTKPTGQGTGLGLSLSYDIVKSHGGELRVETKEGEGSTFIIQLPVS